MPLSRAALALAVVVSALAAVSTAAALIVPQKSIAGVRLEMTQAKVRSVLGKPARVIEGSNDFGPYTEFRYTGLRITFQGHTSVTAIFATRRSERTATGVGVGSTEAQVRAGVRGVRCRTEFGFRSCTVGRFLAGRRVTDFAIKRGRVTSVRLGFVLD
jgi:hypothetical protein